MQIDKIKGPLSHKHSSSEGYNFWNLKAPGQIINCGYLYNWFAAYDPRGIAADGWHVGNGEDFKTLLLFLDPDAEWQNNNAASSLKSTNPGAWVTPENCTNTSKFNTTASGWRRTMQEAGFVGLGTFTMYWASSSFDIANPITKSVASLSDWASGFEVPWEGHGTQTAHITDGLSVRLVNDNTALRHGQTGQYIGNDGTIYQTICIGTQEWISDNLIETKFKNGDLIDNISEQVDWEALITAGRCSYDNDTNKAYGHGVVTRQIRTQGVVEIEAGEGVKLSMNGNKLTVTASAAEILTKEGIEAVLVGELTSHTHPVDNTAELIVDFKDLTPFVYNVPVAMKFTSITSEGADPALSIAINTNMALYAKLTITPVVTGLVHLKGILL